MRAEQLSSEPWVSSWTQDRSVAGLTRIDPAELVPTMLTPRELDYLHWLAHQIGHRGRVVELGCFLGGSSVALVAGLRTSAASQPKIITYDSFCAPDQAVFESAPELKSFGLSPNTSFRNRYEKLNASRMQAITIREGLVPPDLAPAEAHTLYPEQEPISLLFIDLAKAWGVHNSVISVFAPHLVTDAVIFQQDFGDFRTPWLIIHMWQLRSALEPLNRVGDTSSFTFRRTNRSLDPGVIGPTPQAAPQSIWREIARYWSPRLEPDEDVEGWLAGYQACHALHAGQLADVVNAAEQHEQWRESSSSKGVYKSPGWDEWLVNLPMHLRNRAADDDVIRAAHDLHSIATQRIAREKARDRTPPIWEVIRHELREAGVQTVALYGAGRHTHKLLDAGWLDARFPILCIIDDNPAIDRLAGHPVLRPAEFIQRASTFPRGKVAIIPSSDAYEEHIMEQAKPIATQTGAVLIPVYTRAPHEQGKSHPPSPASFAQ
jgi:hypothetical protein